MIGLKGILSSGITELGTEILVCAWVVLDKSGKNTIHVWIGTILCLCELKLVFLAIPVYELALEHMEFLFQPREMFLILASKDFKVNVPTPCKLLGVGVIV